MGIGVQYNGLTGLVSLVPEAYPAFRAGLRVGDEITNDLDEQRGPVMTVHFRHEGQDRVAAVTREKICTGSDGF